MNLKDLVGEMTLDNMEKITQGLKLLELIEKAIQDYKDSSEGIDILLQKLLEESKE